MNPYRTNYDPGDATRPTKWYQRRVPNWVSALVIGLAIITGGVQAATPALRVNGIKFGTADATTFVAAYGCDPTGVADSTTCIQNAVNAAAGIGPVVFKTGTYLISSQITLPAGTKLWGSGHYATDSGTFGGVIIKRTANVVGLSAAGQTTGTGSGHLQWLEFKDILFDGGGFAADMIHLEAVSEVYMQRCKLRNSTGTLLYLHEVFDSRFDQSAFETGGSTDGTLAMVEIVNGPAGWDVSNELHFSQNRFESYKGTALRASGTTGAGAGGNKYYFVSNKFESIASNQPALIFSNVYALDLDGADIVSQGSSGSTITEQLQINNSSAVRARIYPIHKGTIGVNAAALSRYVNLNTVLKSEIDFQGLDTNYANITDTYLVKQTSCDSIMVTGYPTNTVGISWAKELTNQYSMYPPLIRQHGSSPAIVQTALTGFAGGAYLGRLVNNGSGGSSWQLIGLQSDNLTEHVAETVNGDSGLVAFPNGVAFTSGVIASGSSNFDLSGGSGAFKTTTGASTFGGSSNAFTSSVAFNGGATASGATSFDLSGSSGAEKTTTGAFTVGASSTAITNSVAFNGGATASGATSFDLSGSSATFKTPTGAATLGGSSTTVTGQFLTSSLMRPLRTAVADANFTTAANTIIAYTSITAPRTVTMTVTNGSTGNPEIFFIKDESGSATGVNTITVAGSAGNVDGAATKVCVNAAFGSCRVYCYASSCFTF